MALIERCNPRMRFLSLSEGIKKAAHMFLQHGQERRKQAPEYLPPVKDLRNIHDSGYGWKKRKYGKGIVCTDRSAHNVVSTKLSRLRSQQKAHPWCKHRSISSKT